MRIHLTVSIACALFALTMTMVSRLLDAVISLKYFWVLPKTRPELTLRLVD